MTAPPATARRIELGMLLRQAREKAGKATKDVAAEQVDEYTAERMRRKARLYEANPAGLHVVMGEEVLGRPIGGRAVMREQLSELVSIAKLDHVTVQIIPRRVGEHAALGCGFI